jgi:ABC-type polysaccharide/polyol phosphate transport system ATPase subunit
MSEPAIVFDHAWKQFRRGEKATSLRDLLANVPRRLVGLSSKQHLQETFWALQDVCFTVEKGECFGIVGPNGAGKSTALKLASNILRPNNGSVRVNGRVSTLIELGAGFSWELTGYENIIVNATILGLARDEIKERTPAIVDFSELDHGALSTPLKYYSSGMFLRLGFSVAVFTQPDVLLVDEILAVGDMSFQMKCHTKMSELRSSGATVVVVTHNMGLIRQMCDRVMMLDSGIQTGPDACATIVDCYEKAVMKRAADKLASSRKEGDVRQASAVELTNVSWQNCKDDADSEVRTGYPLEIAIGYRCHSPVKEPSLRVAFMGASGSITECLTKFDGPPIAELRGSGKFAITIPALGLAPGCYPMKIQIFDQYGVPSATSDSEYVLEVHPGKVIGVSGRRVFYQDYRWEHIPADT